MKREGLALFVGFITGALAMGVLLTMASPRMQLPVPANNIGMSKPYHPGVGDRVLVMHDFGANEVFFDGTITEISIGGEFIKVKENDGTRWNKWYKRALIKPLSQNNETPEAQEQKRSRGRLPAGLEASARLVAGPGEAG